MEDDGFNGFGSKIWIVKSRTSENGKTLHMIYDKLTGFDSLRTSVEFAKEHGLIGGNKARYYFTNVENPKEHTFTLKNMHDDFRNDRELYRLLYNGILPILDAEIPAMTDENEEIPEEEMAY